MESTVIIKNKSYLPNLCDCLAKITELFTNLSSHFCNIKIDAIKLLKNMRNVIYIIF